MKRVVLRMPPEMIRELDELRDRITRDEGPLRTVRHRIAHEDAPGAPEPAMEELRQATPGGSRAAAARVLLALGMAVFRDREQRRE
jgi:hypothetical protein